MKLSRSHVAGFDLTPMIDVVLLLIIFFLVTAQFSRLIRTPIDLPQQPGAEREALDTTGVLIVDLLADGSLRVDGEMVSADVFSSMLASESRSGQEAVEVLIRPDRSARAEELNKLTRLLVEAGVISYRIATSPPAGGGS